MKAMVRQAIPDDLMVPVRMEFGSEFGIFTAEFAELRRQIHFIDPKTFEMRDNLNVDCEGVNHADFSPDGRYFIASCEFSGDLFHMDGLAFVDE